MNRSNTLRRVAALALVSMIGSIALAASPAAAAPVERVWVGGMSGESWSDPAHWSPAGVPADGDSVVFDVHGLATFDDADGVELSGIRLRGGARIWTSTSAAITLTGGITAESGDSSYIDARIVLTSGIHAISAADGFLTVADLAGPGGVSKTGTGPLIIEDSSYAGLTVVEQGDLWVRTSLGTTTTGTAVAAGATLAVAPGPVAEPLTLSGTLLLDQGQYTGPITLDGPASITGGINNAITSPITGTGPLTLTYYSPLGGPNTYTGGTEIHTAVPDDPASFGSGPVRVLTSGTLWLSKDVAIPNPVVVAPQHPGGILTSVFVSAADAALEGGLTLEAGPSPAAITFDGGTDPHLTLEGGIHGHGALTAEGRGELTITGSAASTSTQPLSIQGGAVVAAATDPGVAGLAGGATVDGQSALVALADNVVRGDLQIDGSVDFGATTQHAGDATVTGALSMGSDVAADEPGRLHVDSLTMTPAGLLALGGTTVGDVASVRVGGPVQLGGARLSVFDADNVPMGASRTIVQNSAPGAITGAFAGLPEGAVFGAGVVPFRITYVGGDGNDVVIARLSGIAPTPYAFGRWQRLDGRTIYPPALAGWGDGDLELFAVGTDSALWSRARMQGDWSSWESLGGIVTSQPAGVVDGDTLRVLARGQDNALWLRSLDSGTGTWGPWTSLGGILTDGPTAASSGPGHIDVLARGIDGALYRRTLDGATWSPWEFLGGQLLGAPAAVSSEADSLDVFARGLDSALWQRSLRPGTGWSAWSSLGGTITDPPSAASPAPNRVVVFARGADAAMWHRSFEGNGWTSWTLLGGTLRGGPAATSPAFGEVSVAARGTDDAVYLRDATYLG